MNPSDLRFRQASRDELNLAVEWAAAEGWNPGLHDAAIFWETDPGGFVCAERAGEVVATGSVVRYGRDLGFMGFFIVRPDLRGGGIGRAFWHWRRDLLRSRLDPSAAIGMDGVFAMQDFYARGGFVLHHRNLRMEGVGTPHVVRGLVPLGELPFDEVAAFDRLHFGASRESFLRHWIQPPGGLALAALEQGGLAGMGVIRPCRNGFKIGPLFANRPGIADDLFRALSNHASGEPIFLDVPGNHPEALGLARLHGLRECFGCARMYLGPAPAIPWHRVYGVTTFELG